MGKGKLIEHFFLCSHDGTHENIKVQIIDHCDPNNQEAREDFWNSHLDTLHPKGLNQKRALISPFSVLISVFNLALLGHTYIKIIA